VVWQLSFDVFVLVEQVFESKNKEKIEDAYLSISCVIFLPSQEPSSIIPQGQTILA
jgi:hypothetical protein